jgi:hypothetical protein
MIEGLERSIKKIQNEMNELQLQIQTLKQRRDNYISYIAPLRRLPPEILSNIIMYCLDKRVELTVLTQSCGVVRDTVLGMTTVWRSIYLLSGFDSRRRMLTYGRNKEVISVLLYMNLD